VIMRKKKKYYCIDCHRKLDNNKPKRCRKCYYKFIKKNRHALYNENNYKCPKCGAKKSFYAKRCQKCYFKTIKDEGHPNYKGGLPNCIDCGKKVSTSKTKRCRLCAGKQLSKKMTGKNNHFWKDGRSLKEYYCKDCGKKISIGCALYGSCLCMKCSRKGNNLGRRLSLTVKRKISKALKGRFKGKKSSGYGKIKHAKWGEYKKIWMRSSWEILFAKYLDKNKIKWQYEPKPFDLGNTTYTPDFYLPELNKYFEIKGWWRDDAKEKFRLFKRKYSKINIKLIRKKEIELIRSILN